MCARAKRRSNGVTAGGTSVMTATVAHTGEGARTQAHTHTPEALTAGRAALTLEMLTFQWEEKACGLVDPNSGEEERCFTRHLHLPSPSSCRLSPPLAAPLLSLSPLSTLPFAGRGAGARAERSPGKLGLSPVQRQMGQYLPFCLWRRKN